MRSLRRAAHEPLSSQAAGDRLAVKKGQSRMMRWDEEPSERGKFDEVGVGTPRWNELLSSPFSFGGSTAESVATTVMEEVEEEGLDLNDVENVVLLNEVLHALCEKHEGSVFYSRGGDGTRKSTERDGIIFHDLIVLNVKSKISSRQLFDMQKASVLWSATRTLLTSSRARCSPS